MQDWDIASHLDDLMDASKPAGKCLAQAPKQELEPSHLTGALAAARKRTAGVIGAPKVSDVAVAIFIYSAAVKAAEARLVWRGVCQHCRMSLHALADTSATRALGVFQV